MLSVPYGRRACSPPAFSAKGMALRNYVTENVCSPLQEIPTTFTYKTGWPGSQECAVVTSTAGNREWPVHFEIEDVGGGKRKATSVGPQWPRFLVEHEVLPGSILVFEVLDPRCLVVTIYHTESPRKEVLAREAFALRRHSDGVVFQKRLRASHLRPGLSGRLVSISVGPRRRCFFLCSCELSSCFSHIS